MKIINERETQRNQRQKTVLSILLELQQTLNYLSIKHLIKLNLCENDVKLLKFKRSPV